MKDFDFPQVTIVTVNYNGKRFLKDLFDSIKNLNYPADKLLTIMVDNGSSDGSSDFTGSNYPWVKIINSAQNLGYAGGNNAGIKASQGKYVALINNDCIVERNWLLKMVEAAEKENTGRENTVGLKTGSVGSKVLFYYSYIPVTVKTSGATFEISDIKIDSASEDMQYDLLKSIKFLKGCTCIYSDNETGSSKWRISDQALIAIPVQSLDSDTSVNMLIKSPGGKSSLGFYLEKLNDINGKKINRKGLALLAEAKSKEEFFRFWLTIKRDMYLYRADIINSCGIEVNSSFYARDRGGNTFDLGQHSKPQEVFGPCGSSLLASRKMLEDTGLFEDMFFTYYEDVDLFWRAQLKGWKSIYAPDAVARHHHCGSNVEWSYSFTYHVLRNRLLAIFRCAWFSAFVKNYFLFTVHSFAHTIFYIAARIRGAKQNRPDIKARMRIIVEMFWLLPAQLASRVRIRKEIKIPDPQIKKMMADF
ncbi:MAG: glycosyltransferase family 2 protein [Actinobacteria bacterium]|nr:glycosyltransferase family 2 protein [Actinomycetota bacterium]